MLRNWSLLLVFFLFGCSYDLKTSLIDESAFTLEGSQTKDSVVLEDCGVSEYCVLQALYNINDFKGYESYLDYKKTGNILGSDLWDVYLQSKINYSAVNESACNGLVNEDLFKRCNYALRFNTLSEFDCSAEKEDRDLCLKQQIFSDFTSNGCQEISSSQEKDQCLFAAALSQNDLQYCDQLWDGSLQDDCRSVIGNSLYFCQDKTCVDFYFNRNLTRNPRLVYCNFEDPTLQNNCNAQIRNWYALAQQNFLYCPSQECYKFLIDKYNFFHPNHGPELVSGKACGHLSRQASKDRCNDFVYDNLAQLSGSMALCKSRDCFDSFRGNLAYSDDSLCEEFSLPTNREDLFALENVQKGYCEAVVRHNKALVSNDASLCIDNFCVKALEVMDVVELDVFAEEKDISEVTLQNCESYKEPVCGSLKVNEVEGFVDYPTACSALEVDAFIVSSGRCENYLLELATSEVLPESVVDELEEENLVVPNLSGDLLNNLDSVDVNELAESIDLNDAAQDLDLNALRDEIDPLGILKGIDLNEFIKDIDLNEVAGNVDLNAAMKVVDVEKISRITQGLQIETSEEIE